MAGMFAALGLYLFALDKSTPRKKFKPPNSLSAEEKAEQERRHNESMEASWWETIEEWLLRIAKEQEEEQERHECARRIAAKEAVEKNH